MLESAVLDDRHRLPGRDADRRHPVRAPQPAHPVLGAMSSLADRRSTSGPSPHVAPRRGRAELVRRRETAAAAARARRRSSSGAVIVLFWVCAAIFGIAFHPEPVRHRVRTRSRALVERALVRHRQARPRRLRARDRRRARHPRSSRRSRRSSASCGGTILGLVTGYFRGAVDDILSRIIDAFLALPLIIVAIVAVTVARALERHADPRRSASSSRRSSRARCAPPCSSSASSTTCRPPSCAASARRTSCSSRSCRTSLPPILVEFTVRLGYAIFTVATLSFLGFGIQPPSPDWGLQVSEQLPVISGALVDGRCSRRSRSRSLVIGVNLIADGVAQVVDAMSALEQTPSPRRATAALELRDLDVAYRVRGRDRQVLRGVSLQRRARRERTASSASPAAASRPRRSRSCATCRATAASAPGSVLVDGQDVLRASSGASCASCARARSRWSTRTRARR